MEGQGQVQGRKKAFEIGGSNVEGQRIKSKNYESAKSILLLSSTERSDVLFSGSEGSYAFNFRFPPSLFLQHRLV